MRKFLQHLIEQDRSLQICAALGDALHLEQALAQARPDLAIVDVGLPGMGGIKVVKLLRQARPELSVLVLSAHNEVFYVEAARRAGVDGYLMKEHAFEWLHLAIDFLRRRLGFFALSAMPGA
ncbi:MAG: two component transcriptional regulator, LuxR family [Verrucomicrobia bacterium]|nr:two component transcriptional regulator, LuxR family [Verrucomicrobiota bacterium]